VLDKLEEIGAAENTLVVFVSDNGAAEYVDSDGRRNAPLVGHKRNLYEGGIRVPYVLRWPARVPAGKTYTEMVSTLDLLPTFAAAAAVAAAGAAAAGAAAAGAAAAEDGAQSPALDGIDLVPFLTGERTGAPHRALYWRTAPNGAIRSGDWKLLLAREEGSGRELARLYDLARDPGESHDLAAANPGKVEELRAAWKAWNEGLAAPRESARWVVTRRGGDSIRWPI
jgi:arylsulfatase A-like enzyme